MDTTSNIKTVRLAGADRFVTELYRPGSTVRHYAYLMFAIVVFAVMWALSAPRG